MSDKPAFYTSCKDCVFAEWNDEKRNQVGCAFDRIYFYQKNSVVQTVDNGEVSHFLIEDRLCNRCRDKEWLEKTGLTLHELQVQTAIDSTIPYDVIICLDNLDNLKDKILRDKWKASSIEPRKLIVVTDSVNEELKELVEGGGWVSWEIVQRFDDSYPMEDLGIQKSKSGFFYFPHAHKTNLDIPLGVDELVNEYMELVHGVYDDDKVVFMSSAMYLLLGKEYKELIPHYLQLKENSGCKTKLLTLNQCQEFPSL